MENWNTVLKRIAAALRNLTERIAIQPRPVPLPVRPTPDHYLSQRSLPADYSRIQPPSTTQL